MPRDGHIGVRPHETEKKPAGCGILGLFGMASRDLLCI